MVERHDAADDTEWLAYREVQPIRAHRNGMALHLSDESGEELDLRRGDRGIHDHLGDRIAAIGRVDHGKLSGIFTQDTGDFLLHLRALEGRTRRHSLNAAFAAFTA